MVDHGASNARGDLNTGSISMPSSLPNTDRKDALRRTQAAAPSSLLSSSSTRSLSPDRGRASSTREREHELPHDPYRNDITDIEQNTTLRRAESRASRSRTHLRERVRNFTWTWFTMTMATGGIANVLFHVPYRFPGLYAIGCIFFILNIVLFIFNVTMISLRFYLFPSMLKASFLHPTECLFVPASVISVGTILLNISEYGAAPGKTGPWILETMRILFWIYCVLAVMFSCGIYLIMWSTQSFTISQMTPIWIFPAYPLLVVGPHASVLCARLASERALTVVVGGFVLQGTGFMVSLMIYAAFLYRLMTQKLPREDLRPGMFVSVGPSGFTVSGIIGLGQTLPSIVSPTFFGGDGALVAEISRIMATWFGLWLWGLAIWFFLVSVGAHWSTVRHGRIRFSMTFYSYIFPNTALTSATFAVARAIDNNAIRIIGCVMTCILIVAWAAVFTLMVRAVIVKEILWPTGEDERREQELEEEGWKQQNAPPPNRDGLTARRWAARAIQPERTHVAVGAQHLGLQRHSGSHTPGMWTPLPIVEESRRFGVDEAFHH